MQTLISSIRTYLAETEDKFNLVFCGSRGVTDIRVAHRALRPILTDPELKRLNVKQRLVIIEGGALGGDRLGRLTAKAFGIEFQTYEADWTASPRGAGYIRNAEMVKIGDGTLALYDGVSKGTKHTITISNKKGIPVVVDIVEESKNKTDEEVVDDLVIKHLLVSLTFGQGKDSEPYLLALEDFAGGNLVEYVRELHTQDYDLPEYVNGLGIEYLWRLLLEMERDGKLAKDVFSKLKHIQDIIKPPTRWKVYMKLDTGGFTGFQKHLNMAGELAYPILRITVKVNEHDPLDIIINPDPLTKNMSKKTTEIHVKSGLLAKAATSEITLEDARGMIEKYFDECGLKSTNPTDNQHTHLIGYNTQFIRAFLSAQLPGLMSKFSPKDIDLLQIGNMLELMGKYEFVPIPQVWRSDPCAYLGSLEESINAIIN